MKKRIKIVGMIMVLVLGIYSNAQYFYIKNYKKVEALSEKIVSSTTEYKEVGLQFRCSVDKKEKDKNKEMKELCDTWESLLGLYGFSGKAYIKETPYHLFYTLEVLVGHGESGNLQRVDIKGLDIVRRQVIQQMHSFKVEASEAIFFKGECEGKLTAPHIDVVEEEIRQGLKAECKDYYEDDLGMGTCAYYEYTPFVLDTVETLEGECINVQISFNYDEINKKTQVRVGFPFYNECF